MKFASFLLLSNVSLSEALHLHASDDSGVNMSVNMSMNGDYNTVNINPASSGASDLEQPLSTLKTELPKADKAEKAVVETSEVSKSTVEKGKAQQENLENKQI